MWTQPNGGAGHGWGAWPALLVVLGVVLVPTACVLWFMTEAVGNERMAVRQKLAEVYRQDLENIQKRVDEHWQGVESAMAAAAGWPAPQAFKQLVESRLVGSVLICRQPGGQLAYPLVAVPDDDHESAVEQDQATEEALALQAKARDLVVAGQKREAIGVLADLLQQDQYRAIRDTTGRLIAPDAALLATRLMSPDDGRQGALLRALAGRLRDYDGAPMSSAQRLFLMQELAKAGEQFLTVAGEELALQLLESRGETPWGEATDAKASLRRGPGQTGVWMFSETSGRVVGLWRDAQVRQILAGIVGQQPPAGASVAFGEDDARWDAKDAFMVVPLSRYMPHWFMALRLTGTDPFASAARRQEGIYLWTGGMAIAASALLGLAVAWYLGRQMRLARLKNDLTATVSHELKTPLASMRVLVDTLVEGRCRSAEQEKEYLQLFARENARLSRLIDNFLTFSRMERNKRTFEFRPVEVRDVVGTAVEALGERASVVQTDVAGGLPPVCADRDALATVIVNLLDNAWKYSGDDKRIEVRAFAEDESVCLAVKDNGIGIARRHQRRIFQRFYQVDQTLSRQAGGCGLGLSIVRFIVEAHGGRIGLESQVGQGSTFTVRLPALRVSRDAKVQEAGHGR